MMVLAQVSVRLDDFDKELDILELLLPKHHRLLEMKVQQRNRFTVTGLEEGMLHGVVADVNDVATGAFELHS
jgi:hypothetical protein